MQHFCDKYAVDFRDVYNLDVSFRMKQARGYHWTLVRNAKYNIAIPFLVDSKHYESFKMGKEDNPAPFILKFT